MTAVFILCIIVKDLLDPHEMPIVRPPRPHGIRRPFLLPDHLLRSQFDERISDIAEIRHLRIDRDGAFIDQVNGIPAAVIVRFAAQCEP